MITIFLQTLPFFALIGLGFAATRTGLFPASGAAVLTQFVFYFALSALLFRVAASLPFETLWQPQYLMAYLAASGLLYAAVIAFALWRGEGLSRAAFEAQTSIIGNTGFVGIPMLGAIYGPEAVAVVMVTLAADLVVFSALIVALVEMDRGGRSGLAGLGVALKGVIRNPMVVSVIAGLLWSWFDLPLTGALDTFTEMLGGAATPGALFAIGCTLAGQSAATRQGRALMLSFAKLAVHPALVALFVLFVFDVDPFVAGIAIATASMPVAGNIYILAQHYQTAVDRVSAAILISTVISVVSVPLVLGLIRL